ncbi:hypothetical protein LZD49_07270 [Dyadobacter sp. CY261]|uniref:hypothetical protein n=1 Tax=Dyadobacter sp. CY261 TaxID=2907203 RepID=UPI001F296CE1|nr:hypothetical protein [Dyadobacter sp. CY261]MCF0070266.1 hypothetical protein [Dyadobacter sp. CY261]
MKTRDHYNDPIRVKGLTFLEKYNLTRDDMTTLWDLFMKYGMTRPNQPEQSKANHYFIQGIVEHNIIGWKDWKSKLTPSVKSFIQERYPQLMVQDNKFSKS